jgi:hypothetical protein
MHGNGVRPFSVVLEWNVSFPLFAFFPSSFMSQKKRTNLDGFTVVMARQPDGDGRRVGDETYWTPTRHSMTAAAKVRQE